MNQEIALNELFALILDGDVSLWVGAGLSMNAGFPSGNGLRDRFWESLNWKEKQLIFPEVDITNEKQDERISRINLQELTEKIVDIDDLRRDRRNRILKSVFGGRTPQSVIHNNLGKLTYFKTIITTNYDRLLEKHFEKEKISVIRESRDLTKSKARKIKI